MDTLNLGHPMRRGIILLILALSLMVRPSASVEAQVVSRADSAAVLLTAARAFEAEGNRAVADALLRYITERFGDTRAGGEARAALKAAPAERSDRSSQVELMVWSTAYGLWLGVAIPGALGADDPAPYGAGLLAGGPVGFLGGRALARSRSLSEGQVRAITFGSLWGSWQGWGLLELMDWGVKEHCDLDVCWTDGPDGREVLQAMVVGGLVGVGTGAFLARKPIPAGVATTANFGALWGTWFGVAGGVLAGLHDDELLGATLLGGNALLLGSALMAPEWGFTRNRARLISIGGVIGLLGGFGLDLLIQPDDEKVVMGIPLAGSIAGLAVGWTRTSDDSSQGWGFWNDRSPSEGAQSFQGSLLSFTDHQLHLAAPTPFPTLIPVDDPRGFQYRPALGFSLFSARF